MGEGSEGPPIVPFFKCGTSLRAVYGKWGCIWEKGAVLASDGVVVFDDRKEREMGGFHAVLRQYLASLQVGVSERVYTPLKRRHIEWDFSKTLQNAEIRN